MSPIDERELLRAVARHLAVSGWNFTVDEGGFLVVSRGALEICITREDGSWLAQYVRGHECVSGWDFDEPSNDAEQIAERILTELQREAVAMYRRDRRRPLRSMHA